tara:strand:- start:5225 stop:5992 length:768 start_codon:yes stop_codon:yes gene_type:complete
MTKNYINLKRFNKIVDLGFFTSNGGVSKNEYTSLNCGISSKDNKNNILKNINIALKNLKIKHKNLKLINQTHSNKIYSIKKTNYNKKFYGDGLITKDKNIALGVLTADCAPIFIFDKKKTIVCCLHSGWKGTLANIVAKGIEKIKIYKINKKNIIAIVGPCLGYRNYEVDKSFKLRFIKKNKSYFKYFKSKNKSKDFFNLRGIINYQLKKEGIKYIYNINEDTYNHENKFFSHRRMLHQKKIDTGRMINIISLRD